MRSQLALRHFHILLMHCHKSFWVRTHPFHSFSSPSSMPVPGFYPLFASPLPAGQVSPHERPSTDATPWRYAYRDARFTTPRIRSRLHDWRYSTTSEETGKSFCSRASDGEEGLKLRRWAGIRVSVSDHCIIFPVLVMQLMREGGSYDLTFKMNSGFQPEHRLWPVDFLGFRDEMTTRSRRSAM